MLDIELREKFCDHSVVEIGTIVCDNSFGDVVPTDKVVLDELSYNVFGNRGK